MKKLLWNLLKILVSAGLIVYILVYQVDLDQVWVILKSARLIPLILASSLMIIGTILRAYRWQILLNALKIHVPIGQLIHLYFVGSFFNLFLPTGMGGDAVKMAKLAQTTGQIPESIGTTLVERATGLWVLFVLALIALPFSGSLLPATWIPFIVLVTLGGVIGGFVVMATPLLPWLGSKIRLPGQESLMRFYRAVSTLGWKALGGACLISLIFDLIIIWISYLIARSLGLDIPAGIFFLFTPIISFSLTFPISIGGLGVREQTYIMLFNAIAVPAAPATAMSLLYYVISTVLIGLIGGLLYIVESVRGAATVSNET